jgi:D-alanine-D-alanine ligase
VVKGRVNVPGWLRRRRIAVLYGGLSEEREISKRTGKAVLEAFGELGLDAVGIDADKRLPEKISRLKIGFCFIALHGKFGEDGTVQGLCELMGIPYSGSGVLASALSMNKAVSKRIFQGAGIPTRPFETTNDPSSRSGIPLPVVVKPVDGGSAIGITVVRKKSELKKALRTALRYSESALIEKFVKGKEVTAPVLGETVLPLIEIVPKRSFYDFKSKYVKGMSDHILPARLSGKAGESVRAAAVRAHRALGCRAFSRVDFIVDRNGRPWILELNSIPGMTETSLFPESARAAGYSFPEMILEIVRLSKRPG